MWTAIVVERIANQLGLDPKLFESYRWKVSLWHEHLSTIREYTGLRPFETTGTDYTSLKTWLTTEGNEYPTFKELFDAAVNRCKQCCLELPSEKELNRLVSSARRDFFQKLYGDIFQRVPPKIQVKLNKLLKASKSEQSTFDWIKSPAGKLGMKTMLNEIKKLEHIRSFDIDVEA